MPRRYPQKTMSSKPEGHQARSARIVPLSCAAAFACFTQTRHLECWFGGGTMTATIDLRIRGRYRFTFPHDDGPADLLCGEYLEVVPAKRLVFTWEWRAHGDKNPTSSPSTVTVEFNAHGTHCEVVVCHAGLPNQEQLGWHNTGWQRTLSRLEAHANTACS